MPTASSQVVPPSRLYCVLATSEPPVSAASRLTVTLLLCQLVSPSLLEVTVGTVASMRTVALFADSTLPAASVE